MASGYTTYKGKTIVDFVQSEAEKEGLSLSAYQKKLVYEDLERKYGMKFLTEMLNQQYEHWEMHDELLKRMLETRPSGNSNSSSPKNPIGDPWFPERAASERAKARIFRRAEERRSEI